MSSNILKAKKALVGKMLVAAALSSSFFGCTMDPYIITAEEQYTRNFIKDFGLVDEKQDWNLAKSATVTVNLGPEMRDEVKVYGKHQSKYYLLAELTGLSGKVDVPVDLPKDCHDLLVVTGGRKYYGNLGSTIDCADMSRGIPNSTYDDDGTNPNPDLYTNTINGYTVKVKHTTKGNGKSTEYSVYGDDGEYQYFNTQQMSPLIATTPWDPYFSLNTRSDTRNTNGRVGLLPESGVFNRPKEELEAWLKQKEDENESIVEDFRINTGADGSFTLFPYYYGTNLKHELGVYLLDNENNPILKSGEKYNKANEANYTLDDFVSFPIFHDRAPGDLQVQPHYDPHITDIQLTCGNPDFELGENFDLQQYVQIERTVNNVKETLSYDDYIKKYGSLYHSRVAYHFWIDEVDEKTTERPDSFARIYNNGIVTPLKLTKDHEKGKEDEGYAYANLAIPTGLIESPKFGAGVGLVDGIHTDFIYRVLPPGKVKSIDIKQSELKMCVGNIVTLDVVLKDKNGAQLPLADYFDDLSVTGEWHTDIFQIYKDGSDHTIKIKAVGNGDEYARVYVTAQGVDGIFDYVHVFSSPHHVSEEYTGANDAISLEDWQAKYFDVKRKDVTDKIYEQGDESTDWANLGYTTEAPAWKTRKLDKDVFTDVNSLDKLKIKIDGNHKLQIRGGGWQDLKFDYFVGDKRYSSDKDCQTIEAAEFEVLLTEETVNILKENGLALFNASDTQLAFEKVELICEWTATGKQEAASDLAAHYKEKGKMTCDYCGQTYDFSGIIPEVTIADDAGYDRIHYTVTWAQAAGSYSASKHKPSARKQSRSVSSREFSTELDASHLNPGPKKDWRDVNSYWTRFLPHQEEVASYPPNICMLARSRGYDIIITYDADGDGEAEAWVGNLGMYLKILGSYDYNQKHSDDWKNKWFEEEYTSYTKGNSDKTKEEYVVFSQKRFNKAANGEKSEQISALSVKHPASGRTFLTFEDMRVTHNGVTPADFREKSSDRDVNDLIFNITNFGGITNDDPNKVITEDPEEPVDDTNSWLWAVEDLGATDDFDFNDMVMKINSVTRNSVKKDDKGNVVGDPTLMFKKVTFTPLCAGGTLPLFVHYAPEAVGTHYTLRPGAYVEPNLEYSINDSQLTGTLPTSMSWLENDGDDDAEIHRWFGVDNSTEMINTRGEAPSRTVKEGCTLYLNTAFTISGFGQDGSAKGRRGGLYVTVNDGRSVQLTDEITSGWKNGDDGESWVIMSPKEGSASQMFMIVDSDTPWRWPTERTHILNPYPKFTDWVGDMNVTEKWYNLDSNRVGYTFPRYDLKK